MLQGSAFVIGIACQVLLPSSWPQGAGPGLWELLGSQGICVCGRVCCRQHCFDMLLTHLVWCWRPSLVCDRLKQRLVGDAGAHCAQPTDSDQPCFVTRRACTCGMVVSATCKGLSLLFHSSCLSTLMARVCRRCRSRHCHCDRCTCAFEPWQLQKHHTSPVTVAGADAALAAARVFRSLLTWTMECNCCMFWQLVLRLYSFCFGLSQLAGVVGLRA